MACLLRFGCVRAPLPALPAARATYCRARSAQRSSCWHSPALSLPRPPTCPTPAAARRPQREGHPHLPRLCVSPWRPSRRLHGDNPRTGQRRKRAARAQGLRPPTPPLPSLRPSLALAQQWRAGATAGTASAAWQRRHFAQARRPHPCWCWPVVLAAPPAPCALCMFHPPSSALLFHRPHFCVPCMLLNEFMPCPVQVTLARPAAHAARQQVRQRGHLFVLLVPRPFAATLS